MAKIVDTSNFKYIDMFGREIKVGDYIVYAGLADRSAVLRAGRVIELTHSKTGYGEPEPKIRCESWNNYRAQGWHGEQKSGKQKAVSLGFLDRMIIVPEEYVSEKIKNDLDGPIVDRW
jgi:hypothetical protein